MTRILPIVAALALVGRAAGRAGARSRQWSGVRKLGVRSPDRLARKLARPRPGKVSGFPRFIAAAQVRRFGPVPRYVVESYASGAAVDEACRRARRAAEQNLDVRYVRTAFLPEEETVLHVFEAPSAEAVENAGRRAALQFDRIVEAVEASAEHT